MGFQSPLASRGGSVLATETVPKSGVSSFTVPIAAGDEAFEIICGSMSTVTVTGTITGAVYYDGPPQRTGIADVVVAAGIDQSVTVAIDATSGSSVWVVSIGSAFLLGGNLGNAAVPFQSSIDPGGILLIGGVGPSGATPIVLDDLWRPVVVIGDPNVETDTTQRGSIPQVATETTSNVTLAGSGATAILGAPTSGAYYIFGWWAVVNASGGALFQLEIPDQISQIALGPISDALYNGLDKDFAHAYRVTDEVKVEVDGSDLVDVYAGCRYAPGP